MEHVSICDVIDDDGLLSYLGREGALKNGKSFSFNEIEDNIFKCLQIFNPCIVLYRNEMGANNTKAFCNNKGIHLTPE